MKNTSQLDLVIELGKRIAILRDELAEKEHELSLLLAPPVSAPHAHAGTGRTLHGSIAERVRSYVSANPGRPLAVAEIIAAHRNEDAATIRSTVHRLANGGMDGFSCVGHGTYRYDHERPFADVRVGVQRGQEAQS